jgi:uncharacterized sporulation protein YeaH/YhbH (DUF444 family)
MTVTDRRSDSEKTTSSRGRFIERVKGYVKDRLAKRLDSKDTSIKKGANKKVDIDSRGISSPNPGYEPNSGTFKKIFKGNLQDGTTINRGDIFPRPKNGQGDGIGPGDEPTTEIDELLELDLSSEEYLALLFDGWKLPSLVKKSVGDITKSVLKRSGYSKEGPISRLALVKTFQQALARKLANPDNEIGESFLEDVDLRFKYFAQKPQPIYKAVMFCIMDVSGSMDRERKMLAKKAFYLLYLFLQRQYKDLDVVFIRHTSDAQEVDEQTFFYGNATGGTLVSSALDLLLKTTEARYPIQDWNLYVCQISDGDNMMGDNSVVQQLLTEKILPIVQQYTYVETGTKFQSSLLELYNRIAPQHPNFKCGQVIFHADIYPLFENWFKE